MTDFIVVHEASEERMVNLAWVEEVMQCYQNKAIIFFAFQGRDCVEQDCIRTDESYDEVKRMIWR